MNNESLIDKIAIVTGAAEGIGREIALSLAGYGVKLAVNDLPGSSAALELVEIIRQNGGDAVYIPADVRDNQAVKDCVKQVYDQWGRIDILVNNAGIVRNNMIMRMTEKEWDEVIDVNLKGAFLFSKYTVRYMMLQSWGRIINIASVSGIVGSLGRVNYSASKGGLIAFTKTLANEVGPKGITVNAIAPGFIVTGLSDSLPQEAKDIMLSRTVLKRFGSSKEVADLAVFLASEKAGYITGQVIGIDGGIS